MAITVNDIEMRVRDTIDDSFSNGYRWNTVKVIRLIYDGIRMLNSIRPESRYVNLVLTALTVPTLSDAADAPAIAGYRAAALSIDERWTDAVVHYVAQKCFEMDSSETANADRAQFHKAEFERLARI